jgi:NADH dehydrogenase
MILIVGSTGSLGCAIAQALLARGEVVRILVRRDASAAEPNSALQKLVAAGAQPVRGDLKDRASLDRACAGVDTVITTANSAMRGGEDNTQTVDLDGNRNLIDAAKGAGVGHFIFVSANGADPSSPVPFLAAKGLTEQHLQASGLPYTIIAPEAFMEVWVGMVVGGPALANQPVTVVGSGNRRHTFISARDVAQFTVASVGNQDAINRKLVLGGPQAISFRDAAQAFERMLGREVRLQSVAPGQPIAGFPQVVVDLMTGFDLHDSVVDMTALSKQFGITLTSADDFARQMTIASMPGQ